MVSQPPTGGGNPGEMDLPPGGVYKGIAHAGVTPHPNMVDTADGMLKLIKDGGGEIVEIPVEEETSVDGQESQEGAEGAEGAGGAEDGSVADEADGAEDTGNTEG